MSLLIVSEADYVEAPVEEIELISPEELETQILKLQKEMRTAAQNFEFEKAAVLRDKIKALKTKEMQLL
jgi:excinuclease ABC subunit B